MARSLLDEIERDALDDSVPVAAALRKCVALGWLFGRRLLRGVGWPAAGVGSSAVLGS